MRIEHWDVAFNHGKTAALNMLGRDAAARRRALLLLRSRRLDARWSTSGRRTSWDAEIVRGSIDDGEFSVWYLDGGRVAACLRSAAATTSRPPVA